MNLPALVMTDIDGVWTDGGMYYTEKGDELKRFNTYDSAGVLFCHRLDVPVCIITGENTEVVARRAAKLRVEHLHQGVSRKIEVANALCAQYGVSLRDCAYIGDDLNDWELLASVGFSAAPMSAPEYIRRGVHYVTPHSGGDGAFRDFVEEILRRCGYSESWMLGDFGSVQGRQ